MTDSGVIEKVPTTTTGEDEFDTVDLDTGDTKETIGLGISVPTADASIDHSMKENGNYDSAENSVNESVDEKKIETLNVVDSQSNYAEPNIQQESDFKLKIQQNDEQTNEEKDEEQNFNPNQDLDAIKVLPPGITFLSVDPRDDDIKEFPSMPVTPMSPTFGRKKRHKKLAPSLALSISSSTFNNNTGSQAVSAVVLITSTLEAIGKHKSVIRNSTLKASVTKALSKYPFFFLNFLGLITNPKVFCKKTNFLRQMLCTNLYD